MHGHRGQLRGHPRLSFGDRKTSSHVFDVLRALCKRPRGRSLTEKSRGRRSPGFTRLNLRAGKRKEESGKRKAESGKWKGGSCRGRRKLQPARGKLNGLENPEKE
eukprot:scaffold1954_cov268-Pinguiococcus_pyrenoidosus.AAC.271